MSKRSLEVVHTGQPAQEINRDHHPRHRTSNASSDSPATVASRLAGRRRLGRRAVCRPCSAELVAKLRDAGDLTGKHLELVPVLNPTGIAAKRLLLVSVSANERRPRGNDARRRGGRRTTHHREENRHGRVRGAVARVHARGRGRTRTGVPGAGDSQGDTHRGSRRNDLSAHGGNAAALPRVRAEARALVAGTRTRERPAARPLPRDVRRSRRRSRAT